MPASPTRTARHFSRLLDEVGTSLHTSVQITERPDAYKTVVWGPVGTTYARVLDAVPAVVK